MNTLIIVAFMIFIVFIILAIGWIIIELKEIKSILETTIDSDLGFYLALRTILKKEYNIDLNKMKSTYIRKMFEKEIEEGEEENAKDTL